jgi:Na+/H+ antiporter NhaD/arsenite permease-like protein
MPRQSRWTQFTMGAALLLLAVLASPALAAEAPGYPPMELRLPPLGWITPFVVMLLCIALLPLIPHTHHWWETNRAKLAVAVTLALITAGFYLFRPFGMLHSDAVGQKHVTEPGWPTLGLMLHHAILADYVPFVVLLFSLYVISGGIHLRTGAAPTPAVNTLVLAVGAGLASFIGTTGASMLLIRPLLDINRRRRHVTHTVVFFIFLVSNVGGCLTPLGDPPLFLGYLRGVPFTWTFTLWPEWLVSTLALLAVYYFLERRMIRREPEVLGMWGGHSCPPNVADRNARPTLPLTLRGTINFVWLAGVVLAVAGLVGGRPLVGTDWVVPEFLREAMLLALAGLSWVTTPCGVRAANQFNFTAIGEVACVFIGIFVCMQVPMEILKERGGDLGLTRPWEFFWATGLLSSFLDNAPTYAVFFETAGIFGAEHGPVLYGVEAVDGTIPIALLRAVSLGAVLMGGITYIGNGPNFMVRTIAEEAGVKMPSFFAYMGYSAVVLGPLMLLLTLVFLR